jgi:outer membrane protein assembly factor BamA
MVFAALVAGLGVPAGAQVYFPDTITFSGSNLTQAQLLDYTGLKPGRMTKEEMQAASDRLHDTGLFSAVNYELNDHELDYTLTLSPSVLPVRYDNFPWWDADTLNTLVAAKVSLFGGALYPGGPMRQQVVDALTQVLAAKGIVAKVSTTPVSDAHGTMIATRFHIDSPEIVISSFVVEGASERWAAAIERVEESAAGKSFSRATQDTLGASVRSVYEREGYLDVAITGPIWGTPRLVNGKFLVPLTATIAHEGQAYTVSAVRFAGDAMTSAESFAARVKIHVGDVADGDLVDETEQMLAAPWKERGYQRAIAHAAVEMDRTQHSVTYTFAVEAGAIYRMGTVRLVGLNKRQERQVRTYWQIPKGAVFQQGLATRWRDVYLNDRGEQLIVADQIEHRLPSYEYLQNDDTHIVDVVVTFPPLKIVQDPGDFHPFGPLH